MQLPQKTGSYESIETDWRKLVVSRKDIDAVDVCTPNNTHAEIALAAAAAGKMILCEKPLAMNMVEGQKMVDAVEKAAVPNTVWYNYRRIPAVTLAKQLIDEGRLGKIFHYRANFLQDWTISADLPQGGTACGCFLTVAAAGSGRHGRPAAHCIDTALWLNGPIGSVLCDDRDVCQRAVAHNLTGKIEPVGIDDMPAHFSVPVWKRVAGIVPNQHDTRGATAQLYTFGGERRKSVAQSGDLHDLHRLDYFDHGDDSIIRGWRSVHVTDGDMPYMKHWWVPGLQIGYEHTFVHQAADFLENLAKGESTAPTFRDALGTQAVCDAVLDSADHLKWESVVPVS